MSQPPTLSEEERALVLWCRWVRDWPLPSLAWGNLRGVLYSVVIVSCFVLGGIWTGLLPYSPDRATVGVFCWLVGSLSLWLVIGWMATRIQRLAILVDKLGLFAATEEARQLAQVGQLNERPSG